MIHDDLARQFARTPPPSLSPEFSMHLRRQLRAAGRPAPRHDALRRWGARLYWVTILMLLARYWRPVALTPPQMLLLAAIGASVLLTLRQAARPDPLIRVLRQALWR